MARFLVSGKAELAADVAAASNATIAAMAAGEITPDEALTVTRVLDGRLRALKEAARERKKCDAAPSKQPPHPLTGSGRGEFAANLEPPMPERYTPRPEPAEGQAVCSQQGRCFAEAQGHTHSANRSIRPSGPRPVPGSRASPAPLSYDSR